MVAPHSAGAPNPSSASSSSTSSHPPIPSVFRPRSAVPGRRSAQSGNAMPSRPLSLAELGDLANDPAQRQATATLVSADVPLRRYLAGADSMKKQAELYRSQGRHEDEFLCLAKCAKLLVEILPTKHPGYKALDRQTRDNLRKEAQAVLDQLSALKSLLNDRFEAWRRENPDVPLDAPPRPPSSNSSDLKAPTASSSKPAGRAGDGLPYGASVPRREAHADGEGGIAFVKPNRSLGFDVREILGGSHPGSSSPADGRNASRRSHQRPQDYPASSLSGGFTSSPLLLFTHSHNRSTTAQQDAMSSAGASGMSGFTYPTLRPVASIRMQGDQRNQGFAPSTHRTARYYQAISSDRHHHPLVPPDSRREKALSKGVELAERADDRLASATAKLGLGEYPSVAGTAANLARRLGHRDVEREASELVSHEAAPAQAYTESGQPLRRVVFPSSIISRFLEVAESNTRRSLETCCFLLGRIEARGGDAEELVCTHMVFPKQVAERDRCDTTDEELLWEYAAKEDLIMLAWLHSHPEFSCFLSSRDLHCHAPIQAMLPEAVAIVVAPNSEPSVGIFRLTDPPGVQTVLACRKPEAFHQHLSAGGEQLALYTDAAGGGHVALEPRRSLVVKDLR